MIPLRSFRFLLAACISLNTCLAQAQISCVADLTPFLPSKQQIDLQPLADGQYTVSLNQQLQPQPARFVSETVRENLNLLADPYGPEFASYNSAERSLIHMHQMQARPEIKAMLKLDIPFELNQVKTIKTMNLTGKMDKFGGTVLLEAYAADQQLLGRVFRRVFIAACR